VLSLAATACADDNNQAATTTTPVAAQGGTTSSTRPDQDLFALGQPSLQPMAAGFGDLGPERPVPDACRPVAAGLTRHGDGFLLVVRMAGNVPVLDNPPALPFGVLLHILELDLGVFVPGTELGGSYRMMRQYQFPDRPALELGRIADGKAEAIEELDVDVRGNELRLSLPSAGSHNDEVGEWALSITCALRHPVDSFYFPTSRLPAAAPARVAL
jgi:hypothetical protein